MPMKKLTSYMAGYIDGDGCFYIQKESNPIKYRAKLIISSTSNVMISFFKNKFGGFVRSQPIYNKNHKTQFNWIIGGKYAMEFSNKLLSYLVEREEEARIFIKFISSKSKKYKEKGIKNMKEHRFLNKCITKEVFDDIQTTRFSGIHEETDYCYLAGFIDAECCLGISKYKPKNRPNFTYKISLICNNTSPNIFYWFKERLGGSMSFVPRNEKNPKHKNQICWHLTGNQLSKILPKIYPYLISKKEICGKLMEFYKTTLPNGGDRHSETFKQTYEEVLIQREKIVNEIHKLNSKGVKNV